MRIIVFGRSLRLALAAGVLCVGVGAGLALSTLLPAAGGQADAGRPSVVIDPGHGGIDGGASAAGVLEKHITLDVAQRLRYLLLARDVPAVLTREADVDLGGAYTRGRHRRDLSARVDKVRESGAALMVSLHVNKSRDSDERGMLVFYHTESAAGQALAQALHQALGPLHPRREPPVGRANLFVLRTSPVPAVMVEMGFISNPEDRALLQDRAYRLKVAEALATAIARHYEEAR